MSPGALTAFATVAYGALLICVTGFVALLADADVVSVAGVGPVPGALAVLVSVLAFAGSAYRALRVDRPVYPSAAVVGAVAAGAHLIGLWVLAALFGSGLGTAAAAAAGALLSWTTPTFFLVAAACAWAAVAMRRTRAHPPQWPWERRPTEDE